MSVYLQNWSSVPWINCKTPWVIDVANVIDIRNFVAKNVLLNRPWKRLLYCAKVLITPCERDNDLRLKRDGEREEKERERRLIVSQRSICCWRSVEHGRSTASHYPCKCKTTFLRKDKAIYILLPSLACLLCHYHHHNSGRTRRRHPLPCHAIACSAMLPLCFSLMDS